MSVIIKGMEMPRSCWECNLHCFRDNGFRDKEEIKWGPITIIPEDFRCGGNNEWHETNEFDFLNERHPDCPITEIPTPHGRLIDADKLQTAIHGCLCENCQTFPCEKGIGCLIEDVFNLLDEAPTIIEAEVSE